MLKFSPSCKTHSPFDLIDIRLLLVLYLCACTPEYDWREIHSPQGFQATFPAKPNSATRTLALTELTSTKANSPPFRAPHNAHDAANLNSLQFTQTSTQVHDDIFSIGVAMHAKDLRSELEAALLRNMQAHVLQSRELDLPNPHLQAADAQKPRAREILASGTVKLKNGTSQSMTLLARFVFARERTYQVLATAPSTHFKQEIAEQFVSSFLPE